jgi:hypothetical protein
MTAAQGPLECKEILEPREALESKEMSEQLEALESKEMLGPRELLARLARAVQMEQGLHITDKSPESQTAQYQSLLLGHINQPD